MSTNINFQFYPARVETNKPKGWVDLDYFLQSIINPKESVKDTFIKIAQAEADGDMELKGKLKQQNLFYFTPCVNVDDYRRYDNITKFTGLAVLDFDHIDYAPEFKEFLYYEYHWLIAVWLSPSKRGVKALAKIPVVNTVDEFKEYYYGIGNEMEVYEGWDGSGQNAVLPLFQSWDPDLMYHSDPETWQVKGKKKNDFTEVEPMPIPDIKPSTDQTERVISIIKSAINNIIDWGHPPLRGISLAAGGYAASGYINLNDAKDLLFSLIDNHNYLQQKSSTYKKTVIWGLDAGSRKPLILT